MTLSARSRRPAGDALVVYFRSLAVLYAAGVRVNRAVALLARQTQDVTLQTTSQHLCCRLHQGKSLADAMAEHPHVFSEVQHRMVRVGEVTGTMHAILDRLAYHEEHSRRLILRFQSAVTYPAFMLAGCLLMLILGPSYLLRSQLEFIRDSGLPMPAITRALLTMSSLVRSPLFYLAVLGALTAAAVWLPKWWRRPRSRVRVTRWAMRVPGLGRVLVDFATARFARALAAQLEAGVRVEEALVLSARSSGNPVLAANILKTIKALARGRNLRRCLQAAEFFPRAMLEMVAAGEQTGQIPTMLSRAADFTELSLESSLDTLVALAEPAIMAVMGLTVGLVVVATMLPMAQMLTHL